MTAPETNQQHHSNTEPTLPAAQTPEGQETQALTARNKIIRTAEKALTRYRMMAYITGAMLLLLVGEMALVYGVKVNDDIRGYMAWIPIAHGWIYVLYLITVIDLWSKMRWKFGRLVHMVLGGVVPIMSFVVEKSVHREAITRIRDAQKLA